MARRKHDDAHRPMGGRGQRGNRVPANWGGAELVEHTVEPTDYEARMRAYLSSRGVPPQIIEANVAIARQDRAPVSPATKQE